MTQEELKEYIIARIYPNNAQEITGEALQEALLEIVENAENKAEALTAFEEIRGTIGMFDEQQAIMRNNTRTSSAVQISQSLPGVTANEASGVMALAVGIGTRANHEAEFACGKFNVSNSDTRFSVGGGNSEQRWNAFEVRGSLVFGFKAYVGDKRVLTTADYDALVALIPARLVVRSTTDYDGNIANFVEAVQNGRPYDMEVYNTARTVRYKITQVYFASSTRISFYATFEKNGIITTIDVRIDPSTNTITAVNR